MSLYLKYFMNMERNNPDHKKSVYGSILSTVLNPNNKAVGMS